MFTGIIQTVATVHTIYELNNFKTYTITLPKKMLLNIKIGSSISNNGCCLTVVTIQNNLISFNLIRETLKVTNMNTLKIGDLINIEKPIHFHDEIGGHLMTGHIDCTGIIKKIINSKKNKIIWIKIKNKNYQKYMLQRGSIGIDGISLTINKILNDYIRISLTPYTTHKTTLGIKKIGDIINIETDIMIKTFTNNYEKTLSKIDLNYLNNTLKKNNKN